MTFEVPRFDGIRVLVIGDPILDRYCQGGIDRISPEAPVPVVAVNGIEERPGAAGNVGVNVTSLGGQATVVGLIGDDAAGRRFEALLDATGVRCRLLERPDAPTATKVRVLSQHQQILRLDFEAGADEAEGTPELIARAAEELPAHDVLVLSDYGKGCLRGVCQDLVRHAREHDIPILIDPWGDDFSAYAGATMITPNRLELERVVGRWRDDAELEDKARELARRLDLQGVLVTLSERGMRWIGADDTSHHWPSQVREVYDVTGAGDTVIALMAAGLAAGMALPDATRLANLAAGLTVAKLGAASVTPAELRRALVEGGEGRRGVVDLDQMLDEMAAARTRGEKVVFTNGCFDLLHAGHVALLQEARQLGDRLVVAVNDDDSVRRLKGSRRPIVPLPDRLAMLAAIDAVDWVLPFAEDTPIAVLERLRPDILVKGGDRRLEDIVGREEVLAQGGDVRALSFLDDHSTSDLIRRIVERYGDD
ncbi:MAG: bifunctional D-glycero-beta-D-manno-heptose-7-phosphate kinase/D-glycero-beta-D-manno-heptose 1-phosphate adenylyltransferase HldE [Acidobacteriota bacterium]